MARLTFNELLDAHPRAHLVVGWAESLSATKTAEATIGRLIETLGPKADWATGGMQDGNGFAVHCVFARPEDAAQLATAVQAKGIGRYAGFASQREFVLDAKMRKNSRTAAQPLNRHDLQRGRQLRRAASDFGPMSEFNPAWRARLYDNLNQVFIEWDPQNAGHFRRWARPYRDKRYEGLIDYDGLELLGWRPIG